MTRVKEEVKATERPWAFEGDSIVAQPDIEDGGDIVCEPPIGYEMSFARWEANAELICRAVNEYDRLHTERAELLEACKAALAFFDLSEPTLAIQDKVCEQLEAAIDKAEKTGADS